MMPVVFGLGVLNIGRSVFLAPLREALERHSVVSDRVRHKLETISQYRSSNHVREDFSGTYLGV